MTNLTTAEKALPIDVVRRSVQVPQPGAQQTPNVSASPDFPGIFFLAGTADGIIPWGVAPTMRDRQLRAFVPRESLTMGAIGTCIATNEGLDWQLDGPPRTVARAQDVLHNAQWGEGWETWIGKISMDWYTQDKGFFTELVRDENKPEAPVIGFNHLDAARCWHTGNPETPVLYQDRLGKWHGLTYWQVVKGTEMPAPHETLYGLQYCALTRILHISQVVRNIFQLQLEKTGGRFDRAVHVLSGIGNEEFQAGLARARTISNDQGLERFSTPIVIPTIDPNAEPKLVTLALADLPDKFSETLDTYMKWYLSIIAMGLLRDYQDFAPMPGNGLGSSTQSQIMHSKSKGKGPAIFQKKIAHIFNFMGVIPKNCNFSWDESDIEEEASRATIFGNYSTAFGALIDAMVIDPEAARALMVKNKMMPQDMLDELNARELEFPAAQLQAEQFQASQETARLRFGSDGPGGGANDNTTAQGDQDVNPDTTPPEELNKRRRGGQRELELGERAMTLDFDDERVMVEGKLTARAQRALTLHGRDIRRKLADA